MTRADKLFFYFVISVFAIVAVNTCRKQIQNEARKQDRQDKLTRAYRLTHNVKTVNRLLDAPKHAYRAYKDNLVVVCADSREALVDSVLSMQPACSYTVYLDYIDVEYHNSGKRVRYFIKQH